MKSMVSLLPTYSRRVVVNGWFAEGGGRVGREYVCCLVLSLCRGVFSWEWGSGGHSPPSHFLSSTLNLLLTFAGSGLNLSHSCVLTTFSFEEGPARGVIFIFSCLFYCLCSISTLRLLRWWCSLGLDPIVCLCQILMVLLSCWICLILGLDCDYICNV